MRQPDPSALSRVVKQGGGQQVGISLPGRSQTMEDVDRVPLVRYRHGVEHGCRPGRKNGMRGRPLLSGDPGAEVSAKLPNTIGGAHRADVRRAAQSPQRIAAHGYARPRMAESGLPGTISRRSRSTTP